MKKTVMTFLLFAILGISNSFAAAEIDPKIISAFKKDFSTADNVRWNQQGDLTRVSFLFNDRIFYAWYNSDAELITTARNLLLMQLPLSVIRSLEKEYADSDLTSIIEYTKNGVTFYHIEAELNKKKYLIKATIFGELSIVKRLK